ncbi:MAG: ABC transporter permease subunit [Lachnospiraceae bacterium]|nr:ABC transporter permease subunit [Lachnospiraceae bacterium]
MRKLLSADYSRLFKSREFYIAALLMVLLVVFRVANVVTDPSVALEDGFFIYAIVIGVIMAAFVTLYVGTEHGSHTIRNKLIAGHTRVNIYLSNYIVCTSAGWLFCIFYLAAGLALGIPFQGFFEARAADIMAIILCIFLLTAVYAGIFVMLIMIYNNRAAASVVSIFLALAMFIFGIHVLEKLEEPEKIEIVEYSVNGDNPDTIFEDNPRYISNGNVRRVYEIMNDVLPGGQSVRLSCMIGDIVSPPVQFYIYDTLIIMLTCGFGIIIFRKKDLK